MIHKVALIFGIIMPFWNIPLVYRVVKRRSSRDISIFWALGVWTCQLLMVPSALLSPDIVWKVFNIVNIVIFSFVVLIVLAYRKGMDRS